MKLLILLLLLVSTASSLSFAHHKPDYLRQRCPEEINGMRRHYANNLSIANMNKLVYNSKLETKILEKLESFEGCPDKSVEHEDGFIFGLNARNWMGFQLHVASLARSMEIACVETRCGNNKDLILSVVMDSGKSPILAGPPGTRCSENRTADSNGLCSLKTSRKSGKYVRKEGWASEVGGVIDGWFGWK
ncbi:hypothetical protein B9Z55_026731 [Caenorhabditis nigoni]|nr:hypothetical protein B9Z55_026731 [Caenorhabditis nigoni]